MSIPSPLPPPPPQPPPSSAITALSKGWRKLSVAVKSFNSYAKRPLSSFNGFEKLLLFAAKTAQFTLRLLAEPIKFLGRALEGLCLTVVGGATLFLFAPFIGFFLEANIHGQSLQSQALKICYLAAEILTLGIDYLELTFVQGEQLPTETLLEMLMKRAVYTAQETQKLAAQGQTSHVNQGNELNWLPQHPLALVLSLLSTAGMALSRPFRNEEE